MIVNLVTNQLSRIKLENIREVALITKRFIN